MYRRDHILLKCSLRKLRKVTGARIIKEVVAIGFGDWLHVDGEQNDGLFLALVKQGMWE